MKKIIFLLLLLILIFFGYKIGNSKYQETQSQIQQRQREGLILEKAIKEDLNLEEAALKYEKDRNRTENVFLDPKIKQINISDSGKLDFQIIKQFFSTGPKEVVGSTSKFKGLIKQNKETNFGEIEVTIDTDNLSTDSLIRDKAIRELLGDTVTFKAEEIDFNPIIESENTNLQSNVRGNLTINEKDSPIDINLTMEKTDNLYNIIGISYFNMSQIGITPPNAVNAYIVQDNVEINFNITVEDIIEEIEINEEEEE